MRTRPTLPLLLAAVLVSYAATATAAQGPLVVAVVGAGTATMALVAPRDSTTRLTQSHALAPAEDAKPHWRRYRGRPAVSPSSAPPGARVLSTPVDGTYVRLSDGTLWQVFIPDRPGTVTWRRGDYVVVSRAAAATGDYDYVLVDATLRARALARFVDVDARRR